MTTPHPTGGTVLRLSNPADMLTAIPYLLGFHPTNSFVVVAIRGTSVVFNARIDLPATDAGPQALGGIASALARVLDRQRAGAAALVGYGCAERVLPLATQMERALEQHGIVLVDVLRVDGDRYWSYRCSDPRCCPPTGTTFDAATNVIAARAIVAGLVALPDRDALARLVAPIPHPDPAAAGEARRRAEAMLLDLARVTEHQDRANQRRTDELRYAVRQALAVLRSGRRLDPLQIARLAVLAAAGRMDALLRWIERDAGSAAEHRDLWGEVVPRVDPDLVPAAGTALAYAAWCTGNGPLASVAVERVLKLDPVFPPARRVARMLALGMSPATLGPADGRLKPSPGRHPRRRSSSRRAGSRPT
jgi:Domain of unknown function (DUF4192)